MPHHSLLRRHFQCKHSSVRRERSERLSSDAKPSRSTRATTATKSRLNTVPHLHALIFCHLIPIITPHTVTAPRDFIEFRSFNRQEYKKRLNSCCSVGVSTGRAPPFKLTLAHNRKSIACRCLAASVFTDKLQLAQIACYSLFKPVISNRKCGALSVNVHASALMAFVGLRGAGQREAFRWGWQRISSDPLGDQHQLVTRV